MKLKAVKDKIVVKDLKQEVTKGGIVIPETVNAKLPQAKCEVLSIGEDVKGINVGDIILCHQNGGQQVATAGAEEVYRVLGEGEVYCIIEEE